MTAVIIPFLPRLPKTAVATSVVPAAREDHEKVFRAAYEKVIDARASHDLAKAQFAAAFRSGDEQAISGYRVASRAALNLLVRAVDRIASLPARSRTQLSLKRGAIGRMWLRAEGAQYDFYRDAIAVDEECLAKGKQRL